MVQSDQSQGRQIQKALRRGAKAVLMSRGMNPSTRRGNKELDILLGRLAQKSYASLEDAVRMGEAVGWEIVKLSEKRNQRNLDASVIRQINTRGDLFSLVMPQAEADADAADAAADLDSNIAVDIAMHRSDSPIEKTPEVTITGQQAPSASTESSPSQKEPSPKEETVTSEPVTEFPESDDMAATVADVEDETPEPASISHGVAMVTPDKAPDGADMDSEADEEPAAADADEVEDVLPDPEADQPLSQADPDLGLSVASKGTAGIADLEAIETMADQADGEPIPEEAISPSSKLTGEEPEILQARQ